MFVCRYPILGWQVGSVGRDFFIFYFFLVKISLVPRALPLFDISLIAGKRTLNRDYRVIDSDKALVNQRNERTRFN